MFVGKKLPKSTVVLDSGLECFFALDFFFFNPVREINLENSNTVNILRLENSQHLGFGQVS